MTLPDIALIGPSGSGKDTVGAILVEQYGYARVSFADPVREIVLGMDPLVWLQHMDHTVRLSAAVEAVGWETAKRTIPEVRRLLVNHAMSTRRILGEHAWRDLGMRTAAEHRAAGRPCVFTDTRFPNEAEAVLEGGGVVVVVWRRGVDYGPDEADQTAQGVAHDYGTRWVHNDGTLDDLASRVRGLIETLRRQPVSA